MWICPRGEVIALHLAGTKAERFCWAWGRIFRLSIRKEARRKLSFFLVMVVRPAGRLELARSSVEFASLATVGLVMVTEHGSWPSGAYPIWFQGQPKVLGRKMILMLQPVHESLKALAV
jgi:hypothetical protein